MIVCEKCSTELPPDAVACYRCGTMTDVTFVRPITHQLPATTNWQWIATIVVACSATLITVLIVAGMIVSDTMKKNDQQRTGFTPTPGATQSPTRGMETSSSQPATPNQTRTEITPVPSPTKTPIDVDKQREEYDRRKSAEDKLTNDAPVNIPPPTIREYDDKGRQLRAICNNGEPSYWQYDKFGTCGMNGGVKRWNPNHPRNK